MNPGRVLRNLNLRISRGLTNYTVKVPAIARIVLDGTRNVNSSTAAPPTNHESTLWVYTKKIPPTIYRFRTTSARVFVNEKQGMIRPGIADTTVGR